MPLPHNTLIESLEKEVENGTFTAWAFANTQGQWCSLFADEACPPDHVVDHITTDDRKLSSEKQWLPAFDLASLTKPLLTNAWLRLALGTDPILYADTPLSSLLEERNAEGRLLKDWTLTRPWLTLGHFLNHRTGLPAWCWFGRSLWDFPETSQDSKGARRNPQRAHNENGEAARRAQWQLTRHLLSLGGSNPSADTLYSDLNYFLLARICENLSLAKFKNWQDCLDTINTACTGQLWHASLDPERSMTAVPFFPYVHSQVTAHIYENRKLENHAGQFGSVHDTNANILAHEFRASSSVSPIVSGHAGLFGSVLDVSRMARLLIETQSELNNHTITPPCAGQRFSWGMDTPSGPDSAAGLNAWPPSDPSAVFGHLGYTGTSLWMGASGDFHVLLTNRTAQRSTRGSLSAPRILFFREESSGNLHCWMRPQTQKQSAQNQTQRQWKPMTAHDAYALCLEHFRLVTRYWDRNSIRTLPNLQHLRRDVGRHLWTR
jgi:CubicO group peptidase (beta-lactamase class C family)